MVPLGPVSAVALQVPPALLGAGHVLAAVEAVVAGLHNVLVELGRNGQIIDSRV